VALEGLEPQKDLLTQKSYIGLEPKYLLFNQKSQFRPPIDPTFPFAQSVMKPKIAQPPGQAIFVDGVGLEPMAYSI